MLNLSNLKPKMKKRARKRVGRGPGSGHGAYSGRGMKGQKARSGGRIRPGFEGGRMPLVRQMPKKRGFRSIHPKNAIFSLADIEIAFAPGDQVSPKTLLEKGLLSDSRYSVKLLAGGKLSKTLEFENIKMSAAAKIAVEAAGGRIKNVQ